MLQELFSLFILLVLGLIYLFFFAKIQHVFFRKLSQPKKNNAVLIVFAASLIAASINLIHIAELTANANRFFLKTEDYFNTLVYSLAYFAGMWVFSLLFFRFSFIIVGLLTPENEEDELIKNNIELAVVHAIILIALSFVIAPALIQIASDFIPYPKMPF
jgi:hypothetical protein